MWKATAAVATLGATGSSWYLWRDYQVRNRLPFPLLTPSVQESSDSYFLYLSDRGLSDTPFISRLRSKNQPIYSLDKGRIPSDSGITVSKDSDLYYVKKVGGRVVASQMDSYVSEKLDKWIHLHLHPITDVQSKLHFEDILKERKKSAFLDSVVVAYVPTKVEEAKYREIVDSVMYEDPASHVMSSMVKQHLHFYAVRDLQTAEEMGIVPKPGTFAVYRYRDARGLFDIKFPKVTYTTPSEFTKYAETHLRSSFKISVHKLQMDLNTYRDCYLLAHTPPAELPRATTAYKAAPDLAKALATVDPLILPLWSFKDLQLMFSKLTKYLLSHPEGKLLVVSINNDKEEVNFNELPALMRQMQLEEIARDNPDTLVIVGSPMMLYHLPLRDFALFHFQDIEVRLVQLKDAIVTKSAFYDGSASLPEWLTKPEWGPESAPFYHDSFSTPMVAEELKSEVLDGDKCYFMMYCSSTCGSCNYQLPYFEEAARKNTTQCAFGKYNIANNSPYFKGPGATPTYLLYTPKGKANPVQYEPRKHGLTPEAMHSFITSELAKS